MKTEKKKISIEISEVVFNLLNALTKGEGAPATVEDVLLQLIEHVQQGIYRPGAWEREWLMQAFGDEFTYYLEPGDPWGRENCEHIFQRPAKKDETD